MDGAVTHTPVTQNVTHDITRNVTRDDNNTVTAKDAVAVTAACELLRRSSSLKTNFPLHTIRLESQLCHNHPPFHPHHQNSRVDVIGMNDKRDDVLMNDKHDNVIIHDNAGNFINDAEDKAKRHSVPLVTRHSLPVVVTRHSPPLIGNRHPSSVTRHSRRRPYDLELGLPLVSVTTAVTPSSSSVTWQPGVQDSETKI